MDEKRKTPTIFVSSTCYDLSQVREDLKDFFEENYGFNTMLSEFESFPIDPCIGTFENCLSNVDNYADIFVLIVGNRYGYVTDKGKSITNLEYLHAKAKGIPVFVFVSKQIYNNLPLWRANKDADFSSIVDNSKIFDFVAEIYDEDHQWIYTYNNVRDIKLAMRNQLRLLFCDGLRLQKMIKEVQYPILNQNIPSGAIRMVTEKPFAWEYKFLAYVLRDEFDKLKNRKWDLKYGIFEGICFEKEPIELMDDISNKFNDILEIVRMLSVILSSAFEEAMGKPGEPSDLNMIIYVSKKIVSLCDRIICWGLYFKSLKVDEAYSKLLDMLYELPKHIIDQVEEFENKLFNEITSLPEYDDGIKRKIELTFILDEANTYEIIEEIGRVPLQIS